MCEGLESSVAPRCIADTKDSTFLNHEGAELVGDVNLHAQEVDSESDVTMYPVSEDIGILNCEDNNVIDIPVSDPTLSHFEPIILFSIPEEVE